MVDSVNVPWRDMPQDSKEVVLLHLGETRKSVTQMMKIAAEDHLPVLLAKLRSNLDALLMARVLLGSDEATRSDDAEDWKATAAFDRDCVYASLHRIRLFYEEVSTKYAHLRSVSSQYSLHAEAHRSAEVYLRKQAEESL